MALSNRQKRKIHETIKVVLILITAAVMMIPIIWICMAAFKTHVDVYQLKVFFKPTLENFATVFESPYDLHHKLWNSTIVALVTVLFAIPLATLAAYSFSRFRMRGERVMFVMILARMIGLIHDPHASRWQHRVALCEVLATNCSVAATRSCK